MDNTDILNGEMGEFFHAMQKYEHWGFKRIERLVSFLIVTLQVLCVSNLVHHFSLSSVLACLFVLALSYFVADLVSGIAHMIMDNNTHYTSVVGPFIANFHLHHAKFFYTVRNPFRVYFDELGTKFWLLVYLVVLCLVGFWVPVNPLVNLFCVTFAIFSSLSEMSHYWCHNASERNALIIWLQRRGVLLNMARHRTHHREDNVQYSFLNGMSDPLVNWIAGVCYSRKGYKNHADLHARAYMRTVWPENTPSSVLGIAL